MPRIVGVNKSGIEIGTIVKLGAGLVTPPPGLLLCHGAPVDEALFPLLFAKIGYTWGNPGGGQFRLPDLRGRIARGRANGSARDQYRNNRGTGGSDLHPYSQSLSGQATGDNVGSPQGETTRRSTLVGMSASGATTGGHDHGGGNHAHNHGSSGISGSGGMYNWPRNYLCGGDLNIVTGSNYAIESSGNTVSGQNPGVSTTVNGGGDSQNSMPNVYVDFYIAYI